MYYTLSNTLLLMNVLYIEYELPPMNVLYIEQQTPQMNVLYIE